MIRAQPFRGSSRFEVVAQVGQGGAGFVYEAIDHESNSRVAVKTLRTRDGESILHLKDEFRVIHDLNHPNLVTPKELFEENGQWFFTMDFVEGDDFSAYVRPQGGALDEARLRSALAQLVVGLCALHASHKVHRDVKPSNILVTPDGRVMILDFGIVTDLTARHHPADNEGLVVGTVLYMAPEQAGGDSVTPAADWYAVGAILYQALTGRLPFQGDMTQVLTQKIANVPVLVREIAPDAPEDLAALCTDLLRTDPSTRPDGAEIMARLGIDRREGATQEATARFVGRREELRAIEAAFAKTAEGTGVTLLVEGESGVGKSMLVREFTNRAAAQKGALVFRGRCYERESVPYKAVDSLIDDLARYLGSLDEREMLALLPENASQLRRIFPVLDTLPISRDTGAFDVKNPTEARARMFDLVRAVFTGIAKHRRLVLVIDDLQWADADSLALLTEVLRPPDAPPLLLLASIRTSPDHPHRDDALHHRLLRLPGDVRSVHLAPMSMVDARELAENLLARRDANDVRATDVDAILAETKGHPLFIDELVRHSAHHGGASPTRLDEALWERATRLAPQARKLLEIVAVAGVPLAQQIIGRAAALDVAQVFDAVGTLRAGHLVRTSGVYKGDTVEAYHDRVRESVLRHLDDTTRKQWHGRLALALEEAPDVEPEKLVAHWQGAGNASRAAECAIRAADEAARALAFDHAASLYRLAVDLRPASAEDTRALKVKLAEALANASRGADAAHVYLEAAGKGDTNEALDLRRRAGEELVRSGHMDQGNAIFEAVLATMKLRAPRRPFAILVSLLVSSLVLAVRGLKWTERAESAIDPRTLLRIDCLFSAGTSLGMTDHIRGKELQIRTLLEAMRVGEPSRIARALAYYAAGHASTGSSAFDRTMEMQAVVARMATELRQPRLEAMAVLVQAFAYHLTMQFAKGRPLFERAETLLRERCVGVAYEIASGRALLYRALIPIGDLPELARRADAALREAEQRRDLYAVVNLRTNSTSFLALANDDVDAAERELRLAAHHLSKHGFHVQHWFHFMAKAIVAFYRGDAEKVRSDLMAHAAIMKRSLLLRVQTLRVPMHEMRARACIAMMATGNANAGALRREAERELHALDREKLPFADGHAHLLRAALCNLAGDRDHALTHLEDADKTFTALGMELLAAVARQRRGLLLGDAGTRVREDAERWMLAQNIKNPARMCALYVPAMGP